MFEVITIELPLIFLVLITIALWLNLVAHILNHIAHRAEKTLGKMYGRRLGDKGRFEV